MKTPPPDKLDVALIPGDPTGTPSVLWRPTRELILVDQVGDQIQKLQQKVTPPTDAGLVQVVAGAPNNLFSIFATESPAKAQGRTFSEVSVVFNVIPSASYSRTRIWITGYKGNPNPVLQTEGAQGPINFLLETTKEVITVTGQPVAQDGTVIDLSICLSTTVALNGVVSAPPAPSISQTLVAIPLGYQFAFNQVVVGSTQDVIDSYRVYRNSSNTTVGATLIRTIKHDATATGAVVVQDTTGGAQTFFYWVSAVNTIGLESNLTNAQTGAVISGPADGSSGDIGAKGSVPPTVVGKLGYTQTPDTGGGVGAINLFWDGTNGSEVITLYRMDGTTTAVPTGNTSITGLAAGSYIVYPFWDDVNNRIFFVGPNSVPAVGSGVGTNATYGACLFSTATYTQAQAQGFRGHVPLSSGGITVTVQNVAGGGGSIGGSGSKCVIKGTKVRTPGGIKNAEDVVVGEEIWGPNGWEIVTEHQLIPCNTFLRFTLSHSGSVTVTPNHIFTMPDGSNRRADAICFSDLMTTENGVASIDKIEVVSGRRKVAIICEPSHLFYAGDDLPSILVHNFVLPC